MLQAPWLELPDGRKMCQSSAISMYCAEQAGMLPSDPFEVARTIELTNTLEDVSFLLLLCDTCLRCSRHAHASADVHTGHSARGFAIKKHRALR